MIVRINKGLEYEKFKQEIRKLQQKCWKGQKYPYAAKVVLSYCGIPGK